MIASISRPHGHRTLPGAPPHRSGGRTRHPSSGEDSTLEVDASGMEQRRPCDTPLTVIPPGHARPEHIRHLPYEDFERASAWNGWSVTEKLMQLPGYLKGRVLQEWRLLGPSVQRDYTAAIEALRSRLDATNRPMATQEFRHSIQRSGECVADYPRESLPASIRQGFS